MKRVNIRFEQDKTLDTIDVVIHSGERDAQVEATIKSLTRDDRGGYFTVDPRTWLAEADSDENFVQIVTDPEEYGEQTDRDADGDVYKWRVKASYSKCIIGDADGDGEISITDATAIQRMLAGYSVASFNENAADVDGNGLDILDATRIQRYPADYDDPYHIGDYAN